MGNKGERTKEKIRSEAYKLFAQKGFKEVTMTDICEKTGLSRGGLYRYYSSTGEVFSEILSQEYIAAERIERKESAISILNNMLETIREEVMEKELSLSLAIYEYANIGNENLFIEINNKAKKRWISLINYGVETGEFNQVNAMQVAELILYYYQGLRMWSRVIPFSTQEGEHFTKTIRELLIKKGRRKDYDKISRAINPVEGKGISL